MNTTPAPQPPERLEDLLVLDAPALAAAAAARLGGATRDCALAAVLLRALALAVEMRDLGPIRARAVAVREGRAPAELAAALAALWEAIRLDVVARLPAYEQALALGLVHTALVDAGRAAGADPALPPGPDLGVLFVRPAQRRRLRAA